MKYIKVYDSTGQIMDALAGLHFVYWNTISKMIDDCAGTDSRRMGLLSYDASTVWHLLGKPEFPQQYDFVTCQYTEIDKDEFDLLRKALDEKSDDGDPSGDISPDISPDIPDDDEGTLVLIKESKIKEINTTCQGAIFDGVDVTLSDGEVHHFSLTEYDQLNLFKLETIARSGEANVLPYHEDDKLCKYYPAEDIIAIANVATEFITYHTTYCNSLKYYVKSLNSISAVSDITYGCEIPEEFQSDVWKGIINGGES